VSRTHLPRIDLTRQLGLRARIILLFSIGALSLSALVALSSNYIVRDNLLDQRERNLIDRARINSALVETKLGASQIDSQSVFGSFSTVGKPSVVFRDQRNSQQLQVSVDARYGAATLPEELRRAVLDNRKASIMRYQRDGEPLVVAGYPIAEQGAGYFEVSQLAGIESTIQSLRLPMILTAIALAVGGALVGWWATRRVLRPLAEITTVAADIAEGRLEARVAYSEWADDPDLAPLVKSFNDMVSALQKRIDRDARFASDVSHELRSPLTTFNATVEVLLNAQEEMPERASLALDLLSSDLTRFTQLVEDLLEISRFDAGAVRLEHNQIPLVSTITLAVRDFSRGKVPVEADADLQDTVILWDKRRLARIVANFIDNAAKYASGATRVLITRAPVKEDADADAQPRIRIVVEDNGPGVPESERAAIFDRFNRGSQGGSRGRDLGVGLGLALAAEHARLGDGEVWVEGRSDGLPGACFVVELPLVEPDEDSLSGTDADLDAVVYGPRPEQSDHTAEHPVISVPPTSGSTR
jgi:signal transduction histidine kinase